LVGGEPALSSANTLVAAPPPGFRGRVVAANAVFFDELIRSSSLCPPAKVILRDAKILYEFQKGLSSLARKT